MNFFEFLEMGPVSTFLLCIISFIVVVSFAGAGKIFIKGDDCIILRIVAGIGFLSTIVLAAASICAAAAKYVIYGGIIVTFILSFFDFKKRRYDIKTVLKKLWMPLCIYMVFVTVLYVYVYTHSETIDYNVHMIYMMAIPEEIFKADYFSRLRIIDVYPYVWSKFHMFNGVSTAIPLAVFPLKNIISYGLARYVVISFLISSIYEQIRLKFGSEKKAVIYFLTGASLICICAFRCVKWYLFMNNYSCFFIMGLLWLLLIKKDYRNGACISVLLALSSSKSTITGMLMFCFCVFALYKEHNTALIKKVKCDWKGAAYCSFILAGVAVMFLTGGAPSGESTFSTDVIGNFDSGWSMCIPVYPLFSALRGSDYSSDGLYNIAAGSVTLGLYAFILLRNRKVLFDFIGKHKKMIFYCCALIAGIYLSYWIYVNNNSFVINPGIIKIPVIITMVFILPAVCVLASCEAQMYAPLRLYLIFAFIQYIILIPDNGMCNFTLIFIPLFYYITNGVVEVFEKISGKKRHTALCAAAMLGAVVSICCNEPYYIYFLSRKDHYQKTVKLEKVEYLGNEPYEYYGREYEDDMLRLNSLKGNRIHYNIDIEEYSERTNMLTISKRFIER